MTTILPELSLGLITAIYLIQCIVTELDTRRERKALALAVRANALVQSDRARTRAGVYTVRRA